MIDHTKRKGYLTSTFLKKGCVYTIDPGRWPLPKEQGHLSRSEGMKTVLISLFFLCFITSASAQITEFGGKLKVSQTGNTNTSDSLVVIKPDGELARRSILGLPGNTGGWTKVEDTTYTLNKVGIGTNSPSAILTLDGPYTGPLIPGNNSNGILRIGPAFNDALDIGKKPDGTFDAWMQAGFNGTADPISFQPLGGYVGIGQLSPTSYLDVNGDMKVAGLLTVAAFPTNPQDAAAKIYLDNNLLPKPLSPEAGNMLYYDGSDWVELAPGLDGQVLKMIGGVPTWKTSCDLSIGQFYQGGYIFYLDATGCHGLIAAAGDLYPGEWGCYQTLIGGTSGALGTGQANTTAIVNGCPDANIAARRCNDLVYAGYSDWYLPSFDEVYYMRLNLASIGIGNFFTGPNDIYYTSTEDSATEAWQFFFSNGAPFKWHKGESRRIRAVRTF